MYTNDANAATPGPTIILVKQSKEQTRNIVSPERNNHHEQFLLSPAASERSFFFIIVCS
jgi:hypothetical protein